MRTGRVVMRLSPRAAVLALLGVVLGLTPTNAAAPPALTPSQIAQLGGADLIDAAQREGRVVVYTANTQAEAEYVAQRFMEQFPRVQVEVVRRGGGELYELAAAELTANKFRGDVIEQSSPALLTRLQQLFLVLDHYTSPSDALYKSPYVVPGFMHVPWLILHGFAYNSALVHSAPAPSGWKDLLDPAFDGRRSVVAATAGGCAESVWYVLDRLFGENFWRDVAARKPVISTSNGLMLQMVTRGQVLITTMLDEAARPQIKRGAPLVMVYPREGAAPCPTVSGIARKAVHPNAARLWVNWSLSELGQGVWVRDLGLFSLREGMPGPAGINPKDVKIIWFDPHYMILHRDEIVKRWAQIFNYTP